MLYSREIIFIAVTCLVPHSKALITHDGEKNVDSIGYLCKTLGKVTKVNIEYRDEDELTQSCRVTLEKNSDEPISMLSSTRNALICENKAHMMQQRLLDRGWQCSSSGTLH